jgi:hypothetical protein
MIVPSANTSVGVALTRSFSPSAWVAASGLSQSPLLSGSLPVEKYVSHALTRSGAHQMIFYFLAESGCSWSIGKRNV